MTKNIVDWFQVHPEISILFTIIGILIGILGIYFSFIFKKRKRISVIKNGFVLIENFSEKVDGLNIKFKEKQVENLVVTRLTIWNSGNETIYSSDFSDSYLRIEVPNNTIIYDFKISEYNEKTNKFLLSSIDKNHIKVDFDYIAPSEGCIAQVIHNIIEYEKPILQGKLKDGKLREKSYNMTLKFFQIFGIKMNKALNRIVIGVFLLLIGFAFFLYSFLGLLVYYTDMFFTRYVLSFLIIFVGTRIIFKRTPKNLDVFKDNI